MISPPIIRHLNDLHHSKSTICTALSISYEFSGRTLVTGNDDTILGATIVASRAGELVGEFVLAIQHRHRLKDIAGAIHPYPTYSTAIQQLAAEATIDRMLEGTSGMFIRGLSRLIR